MESELNHIIFKKGSNNSFHSIAVVADLEGFTKFCNTGTVQHIIPNYLTQVFKAIDIIIRGGDVFWSKTNRHLKPLSQQPNHVKYLGDGALYLFSNLNTDECFSSEFTEPLLKRLLYVKKTFPLFNSWFQELHNKTCTLPKNIRFGVAIGATYELHQEANNLKEYVGIPINLASRLQSYCKDLGVIASSLVGPQVDGFETVKAKKIRGFEKDWVYVPSEEYSFLDEVEREQLFSDIDDPILSEEESLRYLLE